MNFKEKEIENLNLSYIRNITTPSLHEYVIKSSKICGVDEHFLDRFLILTDERITDFVFEDEILYELGIIRNKKGTRETSAVKKFLNWNSIQKNIDYSTKPFKNKTNRVMLKFYLNAKGIIRCCAKMHFATKRQTEYTILVKFLKSYFSLVKKIEIKSKNDSFIKNEKMITGLLSSIYNIDELSNNDGEKYCCVFYIQEYGSEYYSTLRYKIGTTKDIEKKHKKYRIRHGADIKMISLYKKFNVKILKMHLFKYITDNFISVLGENRKLLKGVFITNPDLTIETILKNFDIIAAYFI
jgi:hypothetical protein